MYDSLSVWILQNVLSWDCEEKTNGYKMLAVIQWHMLFEVKLKISESDIIVKVLMWMIWI